MKYLKRIFEITNNNVIEVNKSIFEEISILEMFQEDLIYLGVKSGNTKSNILIQSFLKMT